MSKLVVVEEVGEYHLEHGSKALRDFEVFLDAEIDVPVGHAAVNSEAAVPGVEPKDGLADVVPCRLWIREHVDTKAGGANPSRSRREVTRALPAAVRRERYGIFRYPVTKVVDRVAFAEGLAATVDGAQRDRQAGACGKYRSDRPTAQHVAQEAILALVEVRLIYEEQVIDEPAVERLVTVPRPKVEGIRSCGGAGCLNFGSGTERFGPGEIRLHGHVVPGLRFQGDEQSVVVAVADAGVHAHAAAELSIPAIYTGKRSVHHAAREVETAIVQVAVETPDVGE